MWPFRRVCSRAERAGAGLKSSQKEAGEGVGYLTSVCFSLAQVNDLLTGPSFYSRYGGPVCSVSVPAMTLRAHAGLCLAGMIMMILGEICNFGGQ